MESMDGWIDGWIDGWVNGVEWSTYSRVGWSLIRGLGDWGRSRFVCTYMEPAKPLTKASDYDYGRH